jgi:hypothetical protein
MTTATVEAPFDIAATWRRYRLPVVLVLLAVLSSVVLAAIGNAPPQRPLDPGDASPVGARALAELLRDREVTVDPVERATDLQPDPTGTVFIPDPGSLTRADLQLAARAAATVVVIAPASRELRALGAAARPTSDVHEQTTEPDCTFAPAVTAGDVRFAGRLYTSTGATSCYAVGDAAGLVVESVGSTDVVTFGSPVTFTNSRLDEAGDAALGLLLLGDTERVQWLLPQPPTQAPADQEDRGLLDLLPDRVIWVIWQLVIAVVLLALWRGRRLGPVVGEPLPVIVRATETVRGRARLLRAARARDTAAAALRAATTDRLRELLGLGRDAGPDSVVASAAAHAGRSSAAVRDLLYGAAPRDDAALVALASDLDALEDAVRRR